MRTIAPMMVVMSIGVAATMMGMAGFADAWGAQPPKTDAAQDALEQIDNSALHVEYLTLYRPNMAAEAVFTGKGEIQSQTLRSPLEDQIGVDAAFIIPSDFSLLVEWFRESRGRTLFAPLSGRIMSIQQRAKLSLNFERVDCRR